MSQIHAAMRGAVGGDIRCVCNSRRHPVGQATVRVCAAISLQWVVGFCVRDGGLAWR